MESEAALFAGINRLALQLVARGLRRTDLIEYAVGHE